MRIALAVSLVLSLAACGAKKKSPQSPSNNARETTGAPDSDHDEEKNVNTPDDPDDAKDMKSADPCEGGE